VGPSTENPIEVNDEGYAVHRGDPTGHNDAYWDRMEDGSKAPAGHQHALNKLQLKGS